MKTFTVKAPATTSNMGPGFDCIGMALSLYNESEFSFASDGLSITAEGFTNQAESDPKNNMIYRAFAACCERNSVKPPENMQIRCVNRIPMLSGLGSSSTAILMGIFGANEWGGFRMSKDALLELATELEGHPDNAAPAIFGGLTAAIKEENHIIIRSYKTANWNLAVVVPEFRLPTHEARAALPKMVPLQDAVYNIGHMMLVVDGLREGNEKLLRQGMKDKLHERYRMALLPGSEKAVAAAFKAGAAASGLSGAGPGVIAYTMGSSNGILKAMEAVYESLPLPYHAFNLKISQNGVIVEREG